MAVPNPTPVHRTDVAADGGIRLSWTYPSGSDTSQINNVQVQVLLASNGANANPTFDDTTFVPGQQYVTVRGLNASTQYKWNVQASIVDYAGGSATQYSAKSSDDPFNTIAGNYQPSTDISASDYYTADYDTAPNAAVNINFTYAPYSGRSSDAMQAYEVQHFVNNTFYEQFTSGATTIGTNQYRVSATASTFTRDSRHDFYVRAQDTQGNVWSQRASYGFYVATNPAVAAASQTNFDVGQDNTLSWTYTNVNGRSGIQKSYVVSYRKSGDTAWTQLVSANGNATSVTLPALTLDDHFNYEWKVDVVGFYLGTATSTGTLTTKFNYRDPIVVPQPVTSFNAFTNKTFTWTYTPKNTGDPQIRYRVVITNTSTSVVEYDSGTVNSAASSITVPSGTLRNATDYDYAVTVINQRWQEKVLVPEHYETIPQQDMGLTWEDGTWYAIDGSQPAPTAQYATKYRTGPYSLRLRSGSSVGTAGKSNEFRKSITNLVVGTGYTFSTWAARTTADYNSTFVMGVVGGSNPTQSISSYTNGINFYQHTYSFTATDTSALLYITVKSGNTSGSIADGVFDDMVLTQAEYQRFVATTYYTTPYPVTANRAMHTQMPPNAPPVTHRTDFITSNPQTFTWTFSDRDDNDAQSAYQVQIQSQDGQQVFVDTGKTFASASSYTLPANTLAGGSAYRWHVYVWDQQDQQSPPSTWDNFSTAAPVNVTITAPTDGSSLDTNYVDVTWTFSTVGGATQQSYRVKVINQNNQVVVTDSGVVNSTALTYRATGIASNVPYRIEVVAVSSAGVTSNTATVTFTSYYNNPMKPVAVVNAMATYISVQATNPAISGSRPATTYNEVWRARGTSNAYQKLTTLALGATYKDYYTAAGTTYSYFIRAYAANGNYLDSTPVDGSTRNQSGIVIFDPVNPDTTSRQYPYGNIGRSEKISVNATSRTYVTGIRPEFTFSGNGNKQVSINVTVPYGDTYAADLAALKAIVRNRKVIVYKDNRGRFLTGVIMSMSLQDEKFGTTVSGEFNQTSYTELRI